MLRYSASLSTKKGGRRRTLWNRETPKQIKYRSPIRGEMNVGIKQRQVSNTCTGNEATDLRQINRASVTSLVWSHVSADDRPSSPKKRVPGRGGHCRDVGHIPVLVQRIVIVQSRPKTSTIGLQWVATRAERDMRRWRFAASSTGRIILELIPRLWLQARDCHGSDQRGC